MSYLLMEILLYLLIAGVIGFVVGWVVRSKYGTETTTVTEETTNDEEQVMTSYKEEVEEKRVEEEAKATTEKAEAERLAKEESAKADAAKKENAIKKANEKRVAEEKIANDKADAKRAAIEKANVAKKTEAPKVAKEQADVVVSKIEEPLEDANVELLTQARVGEEDNLTDIKGIGPVLEGRLKNLGVYHFDQIASWSAEQEAWMGKKMLFANRVEREEWVKQAKEILQSK